MRDARVRIGLAGFLGGAIGTLVALELNADFWWLGLLVGFATGWATYSIREIAQAAPRAWRAATAWRPASGWLKPAKAFWLRFTIAGSCYGFAFGLLLMVLAFIVNASVQPPDRKIGLLVILAMPTVGSLCLCLAALFFALLISVPGVMSIKSFLQEELSRAETQIQSDKKWLWRLNTVSIHFFALYYIFWGLGWFLRRVPRGFVVIVRTIASFLWHLVRIIHSDYRLLSGTSALTGVLVGFFAGSVVMGGLVGFLCGPIAYELVSKRLLKVVPVRANNNHTG